MSRDEAFYTLRKALQVALHNENRGGLNGLIKGFEAKCATAAVEW